MTDHFSPLKNLRNLLHKGRLPQSLLLYGANSTAVEEAAQELLMALFCPSLCRACVDCRSVISGIHPELFLLPSGEPIKIDAVRNALGHLDVHASVRGDGGRGWRVILLQNAQNLTEQAANALLKTVEEPPPGAFILVTARHPRNLLPTLRSRLLAIRIPGAVEPPPVPQEILDPVNQILLAKSIADALVPADRIARQGRMKAGEFAEFAEIALRGVYQKALIIEDSGVKGAQALVAGSRRALLSRLHRYARGRNLALNTQLAAELSASFLD